MKRRLLYTVILLLLLCLTPFLISRAEPDAPDGSIEDGVLSWLDKLNLSSWEEAVLSSELDLFNGSSVRSFIRELALGGSINQGASPESFARLFLNSLKSSAGELALLLGTALLSAVITALKGENKDSVGEAAGFLIRCMALTAVLTGFLKAAAASTRFIRNASAFTELAFPVLMTLLTAIGGTASAGALQPDGLLLTGALTKLTEMLVLPLALSGGLVGMLNRLFETSRLGELANLFSKSAKWLIGAASTLFIGSASLKSFASAAFDGVALRSAKYAAGSLIPVVGSMVSGTMDTMLGCAVLIKSGAGLAALIILFSMALKPILITLVFLTVCRLAAALSQPVAEEQLVKLYAAAGDAAGTLMAVTIAAGLNYFAFIGILMRIGGAGVLV